MLWGLRRAPAGHRTVALQSTDPQLPIPFGRDFMPFRPLSPYPTTSRQMLLAQRGTVCPQALLPLLRWLQLARAWGGKPSPAHGTGTHIANVTTLLCPAWGTCPRLDNIHLSPLAGTLGRTGDGTEPRRGRHRCFEKP